MKELWADIPGFDGYQVSNQGRLRSCLSGKLRDVKTFKRNKFPYLTAVIRKPGERKTYTFCIHRLVYQVFVGPIPEKMHIDHANRNALDNRVENLRLATPKQNQGNRRKSAHTIYKGVRRSSNGKKWIAEINCPKHKHLGTFETPEEAARAYNEAAIIYYGEFAHINVLDA